MKKACFILVFFIVSHFSFAQPKPLLLTATLKENRQQFYRNLVRNVINKKLSQAPADATEDDWQQAFSAMELLRYKSPWVTGRLFEAFKNPAARSTTFQRALLELVYANYPELFLKPVRDLLNETTDVKIFAMCAAYILNSDLSITALAVLNKKISEKLMLFPGDALLMQLETDVINYKKNFNLPLVSGLFEKNYLPGNVLMLSFQRRNRDYPGLVIVRDTAGNFITENGVLFSVPQLARSISNLPAYLTNGNTPEGIFRMDGFDTSKSSFIGPTTNVQLTMPFEYTATHFFRDSSLSDSSWSITDYKKLLPASLREYEPLQQAYYAGKAGRTEIIAHGTTVDPSYYHNKPYFPLTPSLGCLCTKEIWDEKTGGLLETDQQKLVDAIVKAGGANGYAIVINLSDADKAVDLEEVLDFMLKAIVD